MGQPEVLSSNKGQPYRRLEKWRLGSRGRIWFWGYDILFIRTNYALTLSESVFLQIMHIKYDFPKQCIYAYFTKNQVFKIKKYESR